MKIINCGSGIHAREVKGIDKLRVLPPSWLAYTNVDVIISAQKTREIDVILFAPDRILLIDLKDWNGKIVGKNGRWFKDGRDHGPSPVQKITQNKREIFPSVKNHFQKHSPEKNKKPVPYVQGCVVLTGRADIKGISDDEKKLVFQIDDFLKLIENQSDRDKTFGEVFPYFRNSNLTEGRWLHVCKTFFNASNGLVQPGKRLYGNYKAKSEQWTFQHPKKIYSEFDAADKNSKVTLGTLRLWDFTQADARFQSEEGRREIAGREKEVFAFVKDKSLDAETALLVPQDSDPDISVNYWEVFDRRKNLLRFRDIATHDRESLTTNDRIELSRQLLSQVSHLHSIDLSHQDIGAHSIWMERPSTVRISHLMTSKIPQIETLGQSRLQFLSSTVVPEDCFGLEGRSAKSRDVYLIGYLIHRLLFGNYPRSTHSDEPGEWNDEVDIDKEFGTLHAWFKQSLSLEPNHRFNSASDALDAFNILTEERPTRQEIAEGLEKHKLFSSSRALVRSYPEDEFLSESERVTTWRTKKDGIEYFMKQWNSPALGESSKEQSRILDFLDHANEVKRLNLDGLCKIAEVIWAVDSIVIAQEFVPGECLSNHKEVFRQSPYRLIAFLEQLAGTVDAMHEHGIGHGDLKPENILIIKNDGDSETEFRIVDIPDFSSALDGERQNSLYAPEKGGTFERDRYAITKISKELLESFDPTLVGIPELLESIDVCQNTFPENGTLTPLRRALQKYLNPDPKAVEESLLIENGFLETKPFEPDHGEYFLRINTSRNEFYIRGLCEELRFVCDDNFNIQRVFRNSLDQSRISRNLRHEFMKFTGIVKIKHATTPNYDSLINFLAKSSFQKHWVDQVDSQKRSKAPQVDQDVIELESVGESDQAIDNLTDVRESERDEDISISYDISTLWSSLVNEEDKLVTDAVTIGDSAYRSDIDRHVIPIEIENGDFDFDQNDNVGIEKLDRNGNWRRIGSLDIRRSSDEQIFVQALETYAATTSDDLLNAEQRLKFTSHFEEQSRIRRKTAIERVMARESAIPNLIDAFNPDPTHISPTSETRNRAVDFSDYGLNEAQSAAMKTVLDQKPLGLVQGPPGTGKTKFIAALAHLALKTGMVSNVLLASQSHEAVNNATESLLKLFQQDQEEPSLLRVGRESAVSPTLVPFHSNKLEQLYKDRFKAQLRNRLRDAGERMAIPSTTLDKLLLIEDVIRPVLFQMRSSKSDVEPELSQSAENLLEKAHETIGIPLNIESVVDKSRTLSDTLYNVSQRVNEAAGFEDRTSADALWRFRQLADIGHDFVGAVSSSQRSFEPFFAGTRKIVSGTCVGLGRPSLGLTSTNFDLVIVDEAARCTASELAVPLQSGRWVVLVGDHHQLEPIHRSGVVQKVKQATNLPISEIMKSDFERLFSGSDKDQVGATLDQQYRMLPPIGRVVSKVFYDSKLKHERVKTHIPLGAIPATVTHPITWLDTGPLGKRGFEIRPTGSSSFINRAEADAILTTLASFDTEKKFIEFLESKNSLEKTIGIICMYADQRDLVSSTLNTSRLSSILKNSIKVGTVDSYQGKENEIVIVSLVRNNNSRSTGTADRIAQGFLQQPNRVNVAMSRAMDRLVIVGSKSGWPEGSPMARLGKEIDVEKLNGFAKIVDLQAQGEIDSSKGEAVNGE